jgi:hypothetical protein
LFAQFFYYKLKEYTKENKYLNYEDWRYIKENTEKNLYFLLTNVILDNIIICNDYKIITITNSIILSAPIEVVYILW